MEKRLIDLQKQTIKNLEDVIAIQKEIIKSKDDIIQLQKKAIEDLFNHLQKKLEHERHDS